MTSMLFRNEFRGVEEMCGKSASREWCSVNVRLSGLPSGMLVAEISGIFEECKDAGAGLVNKGLSPVEN